MTSVFYLGFSPAQQFGYTVTPQHVTVLLLMLEKPVFYYSSLVFLQTFDQTQNLHDEQPYHKGIFKIKTPVRFLEGAFLQQGRKSMTILSYKHRFLPYFAETGRNKNPQTQWSKARIQQLSTTTYKIIVLLVPLHRGMRKPAAEGKEISDTQQRHNHLTWWVISLSLSH